jgi:hypothetical protein
LLLSVVGGSSPYLVYDGDGAQSVGTLPQNDLPQASVLKADGYSIANQLNPGVAGIIPNLVNAKVVPVLQQL